MVSISCGCPDYEIHSVSEKLMTCRTARKCSDCGNVINVKDKMYKISFYDFENNRPYSPSFICEECGDLAENIAALGLCFHYGSIKEDWAEYCYNATGKLPGYAIK